MECSRVYGMDRNIFRCHKTVFSDLRSDELSYAGTTPSRSIKWATKKKFFRTKNLNLFWCHVASNEVHAVEWKGSLNRTRVANMRIFSSRLVSLLYEFGFCDDEIECRKKKNEEKEKFVGKYKDVCSMRTWNVRRQLCDAIQTKINFAFISGLAQCSILPNLYCVGWLLDYGRTIVYSLHNGPRHSINLSGAKAHVFAYIACDCVQSTFHSHWWWVGIEICFCILLLLLLFHSFFKTYFPFFLSSAKSASIVFVLI